MKSIMRNCIIELTMQSTKDYTDPCAQTEVDGIFRNREGKEIVVPGFWAGGNTWKIRFSSPVEGRFTFRSRCSDPDNAGLSGGGEVIEVLPYTGTNPLFLHGGLQAAGNQRTMEHVDGTPFFWLADTWWMGLVDRLRWPEDFHQITEDRAKKGFNAIQLVVGFLPVFRENHAFDRRNRNEGGWAWEEGWRRIDPAFFDMADRRLEHLVQSGLVPCIFAMWGEYMAWMGVEKVKRHWRYLVARYGAYPVVWCLSGEGNVSSDYIFQQAPNDPRRPANKWPLRRAAWSDVARYVRSINAFGRPVTMHPCPPLYQGLDLMDDPALLDFNMLQTGHGYFPLADIVDRTYAGNLRQPRKPVFCGEVSYEGILGGCWQDIQRFLFYTSILSGSTGHTYGADGFYVFSTPQETGIDHYPHDDPYWSTNYTWQENMHLPGSTQMGIGRRFFEEYPWWDLIAVPPQEHWFQGCKGPFAAGITDQLWIIYLPSTGLDPRLSGLRGRPFRPSAKPATEGWTSRFFNPRDGRYRDSFPTKMNPDGSFTLPDTPTGEDWILVLSRGKTC